MTLLDTAFHCNAAILYTLIISIYRKPVTELSEIQ